MSSAQPYRDPGVKQHVLSSVASLRVHLEHAANQLLRENTSRSGLQNSPLCPKSLSYSTEQHSTVQHSEKTPPGQDYKTPPSAPRSPRLSLCSS